LSQLIVLGFRDRFRAAEVLNDLKRRELDWVADLDHAVVVTLDECRRARVQLSVDLSMGETAAWATLWGSLLSVTLFLPATEIMTQAANGIAAAPVTGRNGSRAKYKVPDSSWWKQDVGLEDLFLRDVGAVVKERGSAIFMLLHTYEGRLVRKELQNYGNMIIHTTLSADQDRKIGEFFTLT
jgi:uncharacterized membrane protein